jgi:hypothetical protein
VRAPAYWQRVELPGGISISVPAGARRADGTPVDSTAGWFDGEGYRITFDLERFGERLDRLAEEHGAVLRASSVAGLRGTEVAFTPIDEPFDWARVLQVDLDGDRTLGSGIGRLAEVCLSCLED